MATSVLGYRVRSAVATATTSCTKVMSRAFARLMAPDPVMAARMAQGPSLSRAYRIS